MNIKALEVLSADVVDDMYYVATQVTFEDGATEKRLQGFSKRSVAIWSQRYNIEDVEVLIKLFVYTPYVEGVLPLEDLETVASGLTPNKNATRALAAIQDNDLRMAMKEGVKDGQAQGVHKVPVGLDRGDRSSDPGVSGSPDGWRLVGGVVDPGGVVRPSPRRRVVARKPATYQGTGGPGDQGSEHRPAG